MNEHMSSHLLQPHYAPLKPSIFEEKEGGKKAEAGFGDPTPFCHHKFGYWKHAKSILAPLLMTYVLLDDHLCFIQGQC